MLRNRAANQCCRHAAVRSTQCYPGRNATFCCIADLGDSELAAIDDRRKVIINLPDALDRLAAEKRGKRRSTSRGCLAQAR